MDGAALDDPRERFTAGFWKTGSRHRDPDVTHLRRTALTNVEVAVDDQPGRIETVAAQVPLRVEPDARCQPGLGLGGRERREDADDLTRRRAGRMRGAGVEAVRVDDLDVGHLCTRSERLCRIPLQDHHRL